MPLFTQKKRSRLPLTSNPSENEFCSSNEYMSTHSSASTNNISGKINRLLLMCFSSSYNHVRFINVAVINLFWIFKVREISKSLDGTTHEEKFNFAAHINALTEHFK